jgi:hypothetical protein
MVRHGDALARPTSLLLHWSHRRGSAPRGSRTTQPAPLVLILAVAPSWFGRAHPRAVEVVAALLAALDGAADQLPERGVDAGHAGRVRVGAEGPLVRPRPQVADVRGLIAGRLRAGSTIDDRLPRVGGPLGTDHWPAATVLPDASRRRSGDGTRSC